MVEHCPQAPYEKELSEQRREDGRRYYDNYAMVVVENKKARFVGVVLSKELVDRLCPVYQDLNRRTHPDRIVHFVPVDFMPEELMKNFK